MLGYDKRQTLAQSERVYGCNPGAMKQDNGALAESVQVMKMFVTLKKLLSTYGRRLFGKTLLSVFDDGANEHKNIE
eukprot:scaffold209783_cov21-Prasinocladus_malaysianus.AAC.1